MPSVSLLLIVSEGGDACYPQGGRHPACGDLHDPPAVHVPLRDVRLTAAAQEGGAARVFRPAGGEHLQPHLLLPGVTGKAMCRRNREFFCVAGDLGELDKVCRGHRSRGRCC